MGDNMLEITVDYNSKINYVTSLNDVPLVRNVSIINKSYVDYNDIILEIVLPTLISDVIYVKKFTLPADSYMNNKLYDHINVDLSFLYSVDEAIKLEFEVRVKQEDDEILAKKLCNFEIIPYNHWLGTSIRPDLIASFISPNNSNVSKIIGDAAKIARENSFSMSGYQSGLSVNVHKQINAVFESIKRLNINYISAPASFEELGQKVRSIDEIIENRIANCLDIAILAASCLEAVGINPFIVIVRGHAFVGAWLEEKSYSDTIIEDRSFFLKRLAKGVKEVELFESVLLTSNENYTYKAALKKAEEQIELEDNFQVAIDVRQARAMMIKPFPSMRNTAIDGKEELYSGVDSFTFIPESDYKKDEIVISDKSVRDKMQSWESKLLDLTLRNNLLNFIPRNRNVSFVENNLGFLEDKLSTGAEFNILPVPESIESENRREKYYSYKRLVKSEYLEFMNNEIKNKRLVSLHSKYDLDRSLKMLYREARISIQENGSNALFLAMGFLKWFESDLNDVPRYAPIILYPVEIIRKGGGSGYRIRYRDEEVQINTTLLEKIRNDLDIEVDGLNPLPQDDEGIDVSLILNTIRTAVKNKKRWDVVEWSYLGIFSFSQFVMWDDIRTRSSEIMSNKNIQRIVGSSVEEEINKNSVGNNYEPIYLMPADSSQALAVNQSLKGESFVLYGPPGTGKSQTITNIIVSSLYNGKSVLFVAEKMAALEVVQERLNTVGISDFSLELHSNKTKKSDVLKKIDNTLNIETKGEIIGFDEVLSKYDMTRSDVKSLLLTVNTPLENGMTLYEMINLYAEFIDEDDIVLPKEVYAKFNKNTSSKLSNYTKEFIQHSKLLSSVRNHNLKAIKTDSMKISDKNKLQVIIKEVLVELSNLEENLQNIENFNVINFSKNQLNKFIEFLEFTVNDREYFVSFYEGFNNRDLEIIAKEIISVKNKKEKKLKLIEENFNLTILNEDFEMLKSNWQSSELSWFIPKHIMQNRIRKIINNYNKVTKVNKEQIPMAIQNILDYKEQEKRLKELVRKHKESFKESFANPNIDWNNFSERLNNTLVYNSLILELKDLKIINNYTHIRETYIESREEYTIKNQDLVNNLVIDLDKLNTNIKEIDSIAKSNLLINNSFAWLSYVKSVLNNIIDGYTELDSWLNYNSSKYILKKEGFTEIIKLFEDKDGEYNLYNTIMKNMSYNYIVDVIDKDKNLYGFSGVSSDFRFKEINELKDKINDIYKVDLYEKLAAELPDNNFNANPDSEIGYLKKAIGNSGRGIALRELFSYAPNALRKVAPCMLMSPISVAQYISPSNPKFDLVIFDEASQVETHKAVGAISRGTQTIVVGDPKQLPPTSFFKTNITDESFKEADLPSILDELISLSFPEYYLKWHYRSNHESLITFSNQTYYEDSLYTFPSVDNRLKKVSNIEANGIFGIPKRGQNEKEAQTILIYLKDLLLVKNDISRSIGIVTFNQPQSTLILDMIEEEMDKSHKFASAINNLPEEMFVKNIENVQGDERDLIIFSIGFGPKESGKMSMNFGPINQRGGSKRLNVAITRSRDEMLVFSSFPASRIDLNRTSSEGPRDLKNFLEYAQSNLTMHSSKLNSHENNTNILKDLKKNLKEKGYESDLNVGTSEFKIDLAILDKGSKKKYCAAILIDGGFKSNDSIDDRISTQEKMLNRLGWNTINLWSLDWFINKESTVSNIIKNLEGQNDIYKKDTSKNKGEKIQFLPIENNNYYEYESCYTEDYLRNIEYTTPNEFYISRRKQEKASMLCVRVVKIEQPILFDDLCRKVMIKFDLSVLTDKMRNQFKEIISTTPIFIDNHNTLWSDQESAMNYKSFRIPGEEREFNDIPNIEIKNVILFILKNQLSIPLEGIYRETFKILGFNMLGTKAKSRIKIIVKEMENNTIYLRGEQYNLKGSG